MVKRPLLVILIGYIIGIIFGLYCKTSIAFFIMFSSIILLIILLKILETNRNINRYIKIFNIKKAITYIVIAFLISFLIVKINLNKENELIQKMLNTQQYVGTVISNPIIEKYKVEYKVKIQKIEEENETVVVILRTSKSKIKEILDYGDKILIYGEFKEPEIARNDKSFNYKEYLRGEGIIGEIQAENLEVIKKDNIFWLNRLVNKVENIIIAEIKDKIENEQHRNLILGILLGKDELLDEKTVEDFQNSSLSHILAISGMHVAYVIAIITFILDKLNIRKHCKKSNNNSIFNIVHDANRKYGIG